MSIWKTKPLSVLLNEASELKKGLKEHCLQALVALELAQYSGLFSLTGIAAAEHAGPAVTLSLY
jgi:APA family basic amino acid/polyamine antiporter